MNAIVFGKIYNFSNVVAISETLVIEKNKGYGGQKAPENLYYTIFEIKVVGSVYMEKQYFQFTAESEEELKEKSDKFIKSYDSFKKAFLEHKNSIINCDV